MPWHSSSHPSLDPEWAERLPCLASRDVKQIGGRDESSGTSLPGGRGLLKYVLRMQLGLPSWLHSKRQQKLGSEGPDQEGPGAAVAMPPVY
jgi:hypothetical protein